MPKIRRQKVGVQVKVTIKDNVLLLRAHASTMSLELIEIYLAWP